MFGLTVKVITNIDYALVFNEGERLSFLANRVVKSGLKTLSRNSTTMNVVLNY